MLVRCLCIAWAVLFALSAAGCDSLTPSDKPLPTGEQLRAAYGEQEAGTGIVREGEAFRSGGYAVTASYIQSGKGELRRVFIGLDRKNSLISIRIRIDRPSGIGIEDLSEGMELDAFFSYGGEGDGKSGRGRFYVTAVDVDRVAGVFAADLISSGLVPDYRRITGALHAVRVEE